jgi:hypothetical protein
MMLGDFAATKEIDEMRGFFAALRMTNTFLKRGGAG